MEMEVVTMVLMIAIVSETLKVVAADIVGIDAGAVTFEVPYY